MKHFVIATVLSTVGALFFIDPMTERKMAAEPVSAPSRQAPTPPPVAPITITINGNLPAGTYEIVNAGTLAQIQKLIDTVQPLQKVAPVPILPTAPIQPPRPAPAPGNPAPKQLYLVLVVDAIKDVSEKYSHIFGPDLTTRIIEKGYKWRFIDKDGKTREGQVAADLAPLLTALKNAPLPQLAFFEQPSGTARLLGRLPSKEGDVLKLVIEGEK